MTRFGTIVARIKQAAGFGLVQATNWSGGWTNLIGGEAFAGDWQRNIRIQSSQENLLSFGAVYACISLISGDISKLRITLRKWSPTNRIWEEILPQEVHGNDAVRPVIKLFSKPNAYQTRPQFVSAWKISKLLWGNTYGLKEREVFNGPVIAEHILDPCLVTPLISPDGEIFYALKRDYLAKVDDNQVIVPASEMIHDRMNCFWHPLIGIPPLYAAALSGMHGLAIQSNARKFFENQSRPSGLLLAPGTINKDKAQEIKERWEAGFSGANIGKTAVLGDGMTYEAMTIAAEQSQLAEQWGLAATDVARAFLVPPFKIGIDTGIAAANLAQLDQDYYSQCLQPYMEAFESCQDDGLDLPDDTRTEFDVEGLFRMDPLGRAETNLKRVQAGELAPDEARRSSNLAPVPGGRYPYLQQQNYSLAALAKRDALADPFGGAKPAPAAPAEPPTPPPTAKQVAAEMIAAMPTPPTADEVAAKVISSLPKPEEKSAPDLMRELHDAIVFDFTKRAA